MFRIVLPNYEESPEWCHRGIFKVNGYGLTDWLVEQQQAASSLVAASRMCAVAAIIVS